MENLTHHQCVVCEKTFSRSWNLYAHIRKIHGVEPTFPKSEIICALCNENFHSKIGYEQHLEVPHQIKLNRTELLLNLYEDFREWKKNIELSTHAEYVQKCRVKRKDDEKISYLCCHRSGVFESRAKTNKSIKYYGSNRINSNCP